MVDELVIRLESKQDQVSYWLEKNFNQFSLDVLKSCYKDWEEVNLDDQSLISNEAKNNQIEANFIKQSHYPAIGKIYEARNTDLAIWLEMNVDKLYELGIGVIESNSSFKTMVFISETKLSFLESHWAEFYASKQTTKFYIISSVISSF